MASAAYGMMKELTLFRIGVLPTQEDIAADLNVRELAAMDVEFRGAFEVGHGGERLGCELFTVPVRIMLADSPAGLSLTGSSGRSSTVINH